MYPNSCGCGRDKEDHTDSALRKGVEAPGEWNTLKDCKDVPTNGYGKMKFIFEDTDQTPDVSKKKEKKSCFFFNVH